MYQDQGGSSFLSSLTSPPLGPRVIDNNIQAGTNWHTGAHLENEVADPIVSTDLRPSAHHSTTREHAIMVLNIQ